MRWCRIPSGALGAAVVALASCGDDSDDVGGPPDEAVEVEIAAELDRGPGNLTITPDGRRVTSLHQAYAPVRVLAELSGSGSGTTLLNYPDLGEGEIPVGLTAILGIRSDTAGVLYMLDNGSSGLAPSKLLLWDSNTDQLLGNISLESVTEPNSFVNDLAFDYARNQVYISDPAGGDNAAIVVVDLATGQARRVLRADPSVIADPAVTFSVEGITPTRRLPDGTLVQPRLGVDGIVIDYDREWVYYGALHGTTLYRIPAASLADPAAAAQLPTLVESYATKPPSDGMAIDSEDNIYLGDLPHNAFGVITPDRQYRELGRSAEYKWVDDFEFDAEGRLHFVTTQLHRSPDLNAGQRAGVPPFRIFRFDPLAEGRQGY